MAGPASPLFDWDADFIRTALQHCPHPFLDQDTPCPLCGQVLDRSCAVCPCDGPRFLRSCPAGFRAQKQKVGLLQPRPDPADEWILHGEDLIPEVWAFAATSCFRPASGTSSLQTTTTQSLAWQCAGHSTVVFDGHAWRVGGNGFGWQAAVPYHSALTHAAVGTSLRRHRVSPIFANVLFDGSRSSCPLLRYTHHISLPSSPIVQSSS